MISFESRGSFDRTMAFLRKLSRTKADIVSVLNSCGQQGVTALVASTRVETGLAAHSWSYTVNSQNGSYEIVWTNSDIENGFPVVIMLQYGHGTGTGGFVQGQDFINPAMKPVFDKIEQRVWKAVTSA